MSRGKAHKSKEKKDKIKGYDAKPRRDRIISRE
jgi:hypothetical protein